MTLDKPSPYEKRLTLVLCIIFFISTIISTLIHFLYPQLFLVPEIEPPRIFPGVPLYIEGIIMLGGNSILASFALRHSYRKYGMGKTTLFFFGSMFFAGIEENEWILLIGRIIGLKSYYFTYSILWFLQIPVYTTLGWYFISYCCYEIVNTLLPEAHRITRTGLAGFLAMLLDFFADPVLVNIGKAHFPQSELGLWVWENDATLRLFSIPMMNFIGWWLLVFIFLYYYEFITEKIDKGTLEWKSATQWFFIGFIPLWIFMAIVLHSLDLFFQIYWSQINIMPIDFPFLA